MTKELRIKGTLYLLLLAITMKYYSNGARVVTEDDTLPPLPPSETMAINPVRTPVAHTAPLEDPVQAATPSTSDQPTLSFFMHDIFGGSAPSVRVVNGIVANTPQVKGIPFSKKRSGIIDGKALPVVTQGATSQNLLFGTITVIDDELTQGNEFGSSIIGKAQGFYLASSTDGSSHTMAFTAMFHDEDDNDKDDAVSFFGVHHTAAVKSPIAIVGGTGKYGNAQGFAVVETLNHTNQYTTDGIDKLLKFSVFITQQ
ncbi:putative Chloroplast-targeted copper chaperone protein [Hibiscus syriacus]|uniref:Dirigent protein n=1 Tax=Hibiscus syriacus TaxID=106335 RepID=A0A6A2XCI1_HIBSY|nr:dirigent protein 9-like [Hibiscus syriacus]KAE8664985.1 putative Chloroplast-targeted copper chaperone protein [Hibiscus syriacus]